jgi:hypothetical protein
VAVEKEEFFLNSHTTKTPAKGESTTGCMYNLDLLMMDLCGLKHVEERGNPDAVYRRKRIVYQVGNKDKIYRDARSTKYQRLQVLLERSQVLTSFLLQ